MHVVNDLSPCSSSISTSPALAVFQTFRYVMFCFPPTTRFLSDCGASWLTGKDGKTEDICILEVGEVPCASDIPWDDPLRSRDSEPVVSTFSLGERGDKDRSSCA